MNANEVSKAGAQAGAGRGILALKKFCKDAGVSPVTTWRWRKQGWLKCVTISGRPYLTAAGLEEFNRRAESGEFAAAPAHVVSKSQ